MVFVRGVFFERERASRWGGGHVCDGEEVFCLSLFSISLILLSLCLCLSLSLCIWSSEAVALLLCLGSLRGRRFLSSEDACTLLHTYLHALTSINVYLFISSFVSVSLSLSLCMCMSLISWPTLFCSSNFHIVEFPGYTLVNVYIYFL